MKFAAIDIGTNAARLLIGEVDKEDTHSYVKKLSYTRIPLRLGDEVFEDGLISKSKAIDFANSIHAFRLIADIFKVERIRACATSAMREARNSKEIKDFIENKTGVEIEVISGQQEAKLIFSTFFLLDIDKEVPFVVIDVGGGSTEVSVFENGERVAAKSFQIGTLRLLKEKTHKNIWVNIHTWLKNHVDVKSMHRIYATGGNINKAHKMLGGLYMEPLQFDELKDLRDDLDSLTYRERITRYQLKPDRADVLVPALDIYLYILKELGCTEIIVPKIGLSDGMIYNMYLDANKKKRVRAKS